MVQKLLGSDREAEATLAQKQPHQTDSPLREASEVWLCHRNHRGLGQWGALPAEEAEAQGRTTPTHTPQPFQSASCKASSLPSPSITLGSSVTSQMALSGQPSSPLPAYPRTCFVSQKLLLTHVLVGGLSPL